MRCLKLALCAACEAYLISLLTLFFQLVNTLVCRSCRVVVALFCISTLMACGGGSPDPTSEVMVASVSVPQAEPASITDPETISEPELTTEVEPEPDPVVAALPFTATVEDVTDLVLVTGQSNALGSGTAFDEFLDAPNNHVMAFTNNGWEIANLNQIWDLNWFPRTHPNTPPSNNFGFHFGKHVANQAPGRVVGIILLTAPGQPISHWDRDSQFFNQTRDKVSRAINELPNKSQLDAILWHQGESDGADRDEYGEALYNLIERFRSEPWFGNDRPFICGETAESPVNRQLARLNSDADEWTACVAAEGLPVLPNTNHFNAESLRTLGARYGNAYLELWLEI